MPSLFSYTYLFNLILLFTFYVLVFRFLVFNSTFNNTSVAVSFIAGAEKPEKLTDKLYECYIKYTSPWAGLFVMKRKTVLNSINVNKTNHHLKS